MTTIIGNMDSQLFLGGSEPSTLKDLSQALGKETIDMYNTGESRGNNPSFSTNYQKAGKDLMTMDELAVFDGDKCILQLRGVHSCQTNMMLPNIRCTRRLGNTMIGISRCI